MDIIVLRDDLSSPRRISISRGRLIAGVGACVGITLALAMLIGYHLGGAFGSNPRLARAQLAVLNQQVAQQESEIAALRERQELDLNALALRLGELQARSTRLEALGGRLAKLGELDDGEFDFGQPPAVGGPEEVEEEAIARVDLFAEIGLLEDRLASQSSQLSVLESLLNGSRVDRAATPGLRPVENGWLSSRFGKRTDPFTARPAMHYGVDYSGAPGALVVAIADGVVISSGRNGNYGNAIDIDHGNGYITRYAHNKKNLATVGQRVRAGEPIAEMGATGRATSAHVHLEVWRDGRRVDPMKLIGRG